MSDHPKNSFSGLPHGEQIRGPIIAAMKSQSELCRVYLDYPFELEVKDGKTDNSVGSIKFQPHPNATDASQTTEHKIQAPLLSLVPIPTFAMDEATVQFILEATKMELEHAADSGAAQPDFWHGPSGAGSRAAVAHKDTDAPYELIARAVPRPADENQGPNTKSKGR